MKRLVMVVLGVGLLAMACAKSGASSLGPAPTGTGPSPTLTPPVNPSGAPSVTPAPNGRKLTFEVWLTKGGKLFVTKRTEPFDVAVGKLSLEALQRGPSASELGAGVATEVPPPLQPAGGQPGDFIGASIAIASLAGGNALVNVQPPWPVLQQGTPAARLAMAQIVYTLTQYSTISRVTFRGDTNLYSRAAFDDLLPAILVEGPVIGQRISNPVTVSGTANVFEATVSLRILDGNGKTVANTFTTATCGTGCRGDYSVSVPYSVDRVQMGIVEVYESSAKDGSAINVVDIPVTLTP